MRSAVFVAILVASAALLAGCTKKDDHEDTFTCPNGTVIDLEQYPEHHNATFSPVSKCPKTGGSGSATNSTSQAPNKVPILQLKITDDGGNATNVVMLDGNLTFDAAGSSDPDGSVTGIAVTITDSNTTRTATLYDAAKKTFKTATIKFDRAGPVNVTVAMVDDRAGFAVNQTKVYVNQLQVGTAQTIQLPAGDGTVSEACDIGDPILGASFWKQFSFELVTGATLIEASATTDSDTQAGDASLTICAPDGSELSESGNPTVTTGGPFAAATGTDTYFVGMTITGGATTEVTPTVLVHYEPGAAAELTA